MKKHQNHYDYETRLELLNDEVKHYLGAVYNLWKQKTDIYQALFGKGWIIGYIFEILFMIAFTLIIFYSGYGLSSYQQKDKSIIIEQTNLIEQCDTLPITGAI